MTSAASIAATVANDKAAVTAGTLQPGCAAALHKPAKTTPCRGVVLCLHGFTTGPWQFVDIAALFTHLGFIVYAARLPGHGCQSKGQPDPSKLPCAGEQHHYQAYARYCWQQAETLAKEEQVPIWVLGFSLGGALALDIGQHVGSALAGLILVAPLLHPRGFGRHLLYATIAGIPGTGISSRLNRLHTSWSGKAKAVAPPDRPGHWNFTAGQLFCALDYANRINQQINLRPLPFTLPLLLVVSDCDRSVAIKPALRLLRQKRRTSLLCHFSPKEKVPHAMLSDRENTNALSRELIKRHIQALLHCSESI